MTHRDILDTYNRSIAFAPINSEQLALGYGNRSALLHHLKMFEETIIDVDRALKIIENLTLPADKKSKFHNLKSKLLCRKVDCLLILGNSDINEIIEEAKECVSKVTNNNVKKELTEILQKTREERHDFTKKYLFNGDKNETLAIPQIVPNPEVPTASNKIVLKHSQKYGRHFIANEDIFTGEILFIEDFYTVTPKTEQSYIICSLCLKIAWTGVPCDECPCVFYCSEKCKTEAWNLYHEIECPILVHTYKKVHEWENALNALRILCRAAKEAQGDNVYDFIMREKRIVKAQKGNLQTF